jgi:hypothetical protein
MIMVGSHFEVGKPCRPISDAVEMPNFGIAIDTHLELILPEYH